MHPIPLHLWGITPSPESPRHALARRRLEHYRCTLPLVHPDRERLVVREAIERLERDLQETDADNPPGDEAAR